MNLEQVTELLPSAVIQIADLIGFPATEQLLSAFGGTTFPIGKGLRAMGPAAQPSCAILSAMRKPNYSSRILAAKFSIYPAVIVPFVNYVTVAF